MSLALNPSVSKSRNSDRQSSNKVSYRFDPRKLAKKLERDEKIFSKKSEKYKKILDKSTDNVNINKEVVETFTTDSNYIIASLNQIIKYPGVPMPPPGGRNNSNMKTYIYEDLTETISFLVKPDMNRLMYEYNQRRTKYLEFQQRLKNSLMMDDIAIIAAKVSYIAGKWLIKYWLSIYVGGFFITLFSNYSFFSNIATMNGFFSFLNLSNIVPFQHVSRMKALVGQVTKDFGEYQKIASNTGKAAGELWTKFIHLVPPTKAGEKLSAGSKTVFSFLRGSNVAEKLRVFPKDAGDTEIIKYITDMAQNSKLEKSFLTKVGDRTAKKFDNFTKLVTLAKSYVLGATPPVSALGDSAAIAAAKAAKQANFITNTLAGNLSETDIRTALDTNKDYLKALIDFIQTPENIAFRTFKPNPLFLLEEYHKPFLTAHLAQQTAQQYLSGNLFELGKMFSLLNNCYMPGTSSVETSVKALSDIFNNPLTFKRASRHSSVTTELSNFLKQDFKFSAIRFINSREISKIFPYMVNVDTSLRNMGGLFGNLFQFGNTLGINVDNMTKLVFTNIINDMFKNPDYKSGELKNKLKHDELNKSLEKRRKLYRKSRSYEKVEKELRSGKYNDEHKYKSRLFQFFEDRFKGKNFMSTSVVTVLGLSVLGFAAAREIIIVFAQAFIKFDNSLIIKAILFLGEFLQIADRNQLTAWVHMFYKIIRGGNAATLVLGKIVTDIFSVNTATFFGMPKIKAQNIAFKYLMMIKNEILKMIADFKTSICDASAFMATKSETFEAFIHNNIVEMCLKIGGMITDLLISCTINAGFRQKQMAWAQYIRATDFSKFIRTFSVRNLIDSVADIAQQKPLVLLIGDMFSNDQGRVDNARAAFTNLGNLKGEDQAFPRPRQTHGPTVGRRAILTEEAQKDDSYFFNWVLDGAVSIYDGDMIDRMKQRFSDSTGVAEDNDGIKIVRTCEGGECFVTNAGAMASSFNRPEVVVFHIYIREFLRSKSTSGRLSASDRRLAEGWLGEKQSRHLQTIPTTFSLDFSEKFREYLITQKGKAPSDHVRQYIDDIESRDTAYWGAHFYGSKLGAAENYLKADGLVGKIDLLITLNDKIEADRVKAGVSQLPPDTTPFSFPPFPLPPQDQSPAPPTALTVSNQELEDLKKQIKDVFNKVPPSAPSTVEAQLERFSRRLAAMQNPVPMVAPVKGNMFQRLWGHIQSDAAIVHNALANAVYGKKGTFPDQTAGAMMLELLESLSFKKSFITRYGEVLVAAKDIMIDDTFIVGPYSSTFIGTEDCSKITKDKKTITDLMKLIRDIHEWNTFFPTESKKLHIKLGKCAPDEIIKVLLDSGLNPKVIHKETIKFSLEDTERDKQIKLTEIYKEWKTLTSLSPVPSEAVASAQRQQFLEDEWTKLTTVGGVEQQRTYKYISDPAYNYIYGRGGHLYNSPNNSIQWIGSDTQDIHVLLPDHLKFVYGTEEGQTLSLGSVDLADMLITGGKRVDCSKVGILTTREILMRGLTGSTTRKAVTITESACTFSGKTGEYKGSESLFNQIDNYKDQYKDPRQQTWLQHSEKELYKHIKAREELFKNLPILMHNFKTTKWTNGPFSEFSSEQKHGLSSFNRVWREVAAEDAGSNIQASQELIKLWGDVKKCSPVAERGGSEGVGFGEIPDAQINKFTLPFILFNKPILKELLKPACQNVQERVRELLQSSSGIDPFPTIGSITDPEEFRLKFSAQLMQKLIGGYPGIDKNTKVYTNDEEYKTDLDKYEACLQKPGTECGAPPFYLKVNPEYEKKNRKYFKDVYGIGTDGNIDDEEFLIFLTLVRASSTNYDLDRWEMGYNIDMLRALGVTEKNTNYGVEQTNALTKYFRISAKTPDDPDSLYKFIFGEFKSRGTTNTITYNSVGKVMKEVAGVFDLDKEFEAVDDKITTILKTCASTPTDPLCDKPELLKTYTAFVTTLEKKIFESGKIGVDERKLFEVLDKIQITDNTVGRIMSNIQSTTTKWDNEERVRKEVADAEAADAAAAASGAFQPPSAAPPPAPPRRIDTATRAQPSSVGAALGATAPIKETAAQPPVRRPVGDGPVRNVLDDSTANRYVDPTNMLTNDQVTALGTKTADVTSRITDYINSIMDALSNMTGSKFLEQIKNLLGTMFAGISSGIDGSRGAPGYADEKLGTTDAESTDTATRNKLKEINHLQRQNICGYFKEAFSITTTGTTPVAHIKPEFSEVMVRFKADAAQQVWKRDLFRHDIEEIIKSECIVQSKSTRFSNAIGKTHTAVRGITGVIEGFGRVQYYTDGMTELMEQITHIGLDTFVATLVVTLGGTSAFALACVGSMLIPGVNIISATPCSVALGSLVPIIMTQAGAAMVVAVVAVNKKMKEWGMGDIGAYGRTVIGAGKGITDLSVTKERNTMALVKQFNSDIIDIFGKELTPGDITTPKGVIYYKGTELRHNIDWKQGPADGVERCIIIINDPLNPDQEPVCRKLSEFKKMDKAEKVDITQGKIDKWKSEGALGRKKILKLFNLYQSLASPDFADILTMVGQEAFGQMNPGNIGVGIDHTLFSTDSVFMGGIKALWGLGGNANLDEFLNMRPSSLAGMGTDTTRIKYYIGQKNWLHYEKAGSASFIDGAGQLLDMGGAFMDSDLSGEWTQLTKEMNEIGGLIAKDAAAAKNASGSMKDLKNVAMGIKEKFAALFEMFGPQGFWDNIHAQFNQRPPPSDAKDVLGNKESKELTEELSKRAAGYSERLEKLSRKFRWMTIRLAVNSQRADIGVATKSAASDIFGKDTILSFLITQVQESYRLSPETKKVEEATVPGPTDKPSDEKKKKTLSNEIDDIYKPTDDNTSDTLFTTHKKLQEYFHIQMALHLCDQYSKTGGGFMQTTQVIAMNAPNAMNLVGKTASYAARWLWHRGDLGGEQMPHTVFVQAMTHNVKTYNYVNDPTVLKPKVGNLLLNSFAPTCVNEVNSAGQTTVTGKNKHDDLINALKIMEKENPDVRKFLCNTMYYNIADNTADDKFRLMYAKDTAGLLYSATWKRICPKTLKKNNIIRPPQFMMINDDKKLVHVLENYLSKCDGETEAEKALDFKAEMDNNGLWDSVLTPDAKKDFCAMVGKTDCFNPVHNSFPGSDIIVNEVNAFILMFKWNEVNRRTLRDYQNERFKSFASQGGIDLDKRDGVASTLDFLNLFGAQDGDGSLFQVHDKFILNTGNHGKKLQKSVKTYVEKYVARFVKVPEPTEPNNIWYDFVKHSFSINGSQTATDLGIRSVSGAGGTDIQILTQNFGQDNAWSFVYNGGLRAKHLAINKAFNTWVDTDSGIGGMMRKVDDGTVKEGSVLVNLNRAASAAGATSAEYKDLFKSLVEASIIYLYPQSKSPLLPVDKITDVIIKKGIADANACILARNCAPSRFFQETMYSIITQLNIEEPGSKEGLKVNCSGAMEQAETNCKMTHIHDQGEMLSFMLQNYKWKKTVNAKVASGVDVEFKVGKISGNYQIEGLALEDIFASEAERIKKVKKAEEKLIKDFWDQGGPLAKKSIQTLINKIKKLEGTENPITVYNVIKEYSKPKNIYANIVEKIYAKPVAPIEDGVTFTKNTFLVEAEKVLKMFLPDTTIDDASIKLHRVVTKEEFSRIYDAKMKSFATAITDVHRKNIAYMKADRTSWNDEDVSRNITDKLRDVYTRYKIAYPGGYCTFDSLEGAESWDETKITKFMESPGKLLHFPPKPTDITDDSLWKESTSSEEYSSLTRVIVSRKILPPLYLKRGNYITILRNEDKDPSETLRDKLQRNTQGIIDVNNKINNILGIIHPNTSLENLASPVTPKKIFEQYLKEQLHLAKETINTPKIYELVLDSIKIKLKYFNSPTTSTYIDELKQYEKDLEPLKRGLTDTIIANLAKSDVDLEGAKSDLRRLDYSEEEIVRFVQKAVDKAKTETQESLEVAIQEIIIGVLRGTIKLTDVNKKLRTEGGFVGDDMRVGNKDECLQDLENLCKTVNGTNKCTDKKMLFKKSSSKVLNNRHLGDKPATIKKLTNLGWTEKGAKRLLERHDKYKTKINELGEYLKNKELELVPETKPTNLLDKMNMKEIKIKDSRCEDVYNKATWTWDKKFCVNEEIILKKADDKEEWVSDLKDTNNKPLYALIYNTNSLLAHFRGAWMDESTIPSTKDAFWVSPNGKLAKVAEEKLEAEARTMKQFNKLRTYLNGNSLELISDPGTRITPNQIKIKDNRCKGGGVFSRGEEVCVEKSIVLKKVNGEDKWISDLTYSDGRPLYTLIYEQSRWPGANWWTANSKIPDEVEAKAIIEKAEAATAAKPRTGGGIDINTNTYNNHPSLSMVMDSEDEDDNCTIV